MCSAIAAGAPLSAQSQTVTLNGSAAGYRFRTLLSSPGELRISGPGERLTLPAYGAWVAAVE